MLQRTRCIHSHVFGPRVLIIYFPITPRSGVFYSVLCHGRFTNDYNLVYEGTKRYTFFFYPCVAKLYETSTKRHLRHSSYNTTFLLLDLFYLMQYLLVIQ